MVLTRMSSHQQLNANDEERRHAAPLSSRPYRRPSCPAGNERRPYMRLLSLHLPVPLRRAGWLLASLATLLSLLLLPAALPAQTCNRTISADIVALDQVFFWNR